MRNFSICVAAWALIAVGSNAQAQQAQKGVAADSQTITQCLKKARDTGDLGGNCIGVIADPCITVAKKKNSFVEDGKACAARELAVWNALEAEAIKRVRAGNFKEVTGPVVEGQKTLAQSKDKFCPVFDVIDPNEAVGGANYCRLQETARRVLLLRRIGDAVNER